jgi:hypothetical protein
MRIVSRMNDECRMMNVEVRYSIYFICQKERSEASGS